MKVHGLYDKVLATFVVRSVGDKPYGRVDTMEVHEPAGCRPPRPGDVLQVWIDVSTPYAVAPREGGQP